MKFVVAACAVGIIFFGRAAAQRVLADGLEYDQIVYQSADVAAHPPGSFDSDLTSIEVAVLNGDLGTVASRKRMAELTKQAEDPARLAAMSAISMIPIFGSLGAVLANKALRATLKAEGASMGKSMAQAYQTEQRLGKWYHVVSLNGWTRREDVANQTVLIVKPDTNERIYLDLAMQTYYKTPATDSPKSEADARKVICAPSTTVDLGPKMLDGINTELFQTTFTTSQMTATVARYESSYVETPKRDAAGNLIPFDCPADTVHTGPPMPTDRVSLYSTMKLTSGSAVVSNFDEIGNIKQGAEDTALFEVPPGFKAKSPGSP